MRRVYTYDVPLNEEQIAHHSKYIQHRLRELAQLPGCRVVSIVERGGSNRRFVPGEYEACWILSTSGRYATPSERRLGEKIKLHADILKALSRLG